MSFISIREASKELGISQYELRRGIDAKEYPAIRIGYGDKKRIRINPEQVRLFLNQLALENVKENEEADPC